VNPDAHRAILRQPWLAWRRQHGLGFSFGMALVLVLAALLVSRMLKISPPQTLAGLALVALAVLWWLQIDGLLRQNRPVLARLLPGQASALRRCLLVQAGLIGAAAFGVLSAAQGPRAEWLWLIAPTMLLLAWVQREPWLWLPVSLWPLVPLSGRAPVEQAANLSWPAQALLLLGLAWLLLQVLGSGGAWHRRDDARRQRWWAAARARTDGRAQPAATQGRLVHRMARPLIWPLTLYRHWLLQHARPGNLLQRLDLGLQVGGQGPMLLWLLLGIVALFAVGFALLMAFTDSGLGWPRVIDKVGVALCIGVFGVLCSPLSGRTAALWGRRREQALLVLLPGPPAGADLAAALEARWRREHLALWTLGTILVLGSMAVGSPDHLEFGAAFAACCLPLSWWAQNRHRRLRSVPSAWEALLGVQLAIPPALLAYEAEVPAWASLAVGVLVYALCAWRATPPDRALLPLGR
jgi:hypothetical protein